MGFKRARNPEQIAARREEILDAADALYRRGGFDALSLNAIAREAGLAKSAVYRYFESKEEIFIHFLTEEWEEWIVDLESALAPLADSDDVDAVSEAVVGCWTTRPRMVDLMSIASRTLEKNVSVTRVIEFKTSLLPVFVRASNAFHAAMPSFDMTDSYRVFLHIYAFTTGLWSSRATGAISEALEAPGLEIFCFKFEDALFDGVKTLIVGAMATSEKR